MCLWRPWVRFTVLRAATPVQWGSTGTTIMKSREHIELGINGLANTLAPFLLLSWKTRPSSLVKSGSLAPQYRCHSCHAHRRAPISLSEREAPSPIYRSIGRTVSDELPLTASSNQTWCVSGFTRPVPDRIIPARGEWVLVATRGTRFDGELRHKTVGHGGWHWHERNCSICR